MSRQPAVQIEIPRATTRATTQVLLCAIALFILTSSLGQIGARAEPNRSMTSPSAPSPSALLSRDQRGSRADIDRGQVLRGRVSRREVEEVAQGGLPRLLAQVRITPARSRGRFIGFKLAQVPPTSLAAQVGFRAGDVLMKVNDEPIGRPDQMMHALSLLPFAPQLKILFTREGAQRVWIWEIITP